MFSTKTVQARSARSRSYPNRCRAVYCRRDRVCSPVQRYKDRRDNEDADNDAVADELIGDYSLDKEREQDEGEDLRKGNEVELFDILEQLVVMVASDSLHEDAAEAGNCQQDELDETQSEELREPVGSFADR